MTCTGMFLPVGRERDELTRTLREKSCLPVYLDAKTVDLYYNGFCNSVLWPLFHYVPLQVGSLLHLHVLGLPSCFSLLEQIHSDVALPSAMVKVQ